MSAYLDAVVADAPVHYWRFADPSGLIAHDIGSAPWQLACSNGAALGYSGPVSDGGSFVRPLTPNVSSVASLLFAAPASWEFWFWHWGYAVLQDLWAWDDASANNMVFRLGATFAMSFGVGARSGVALGPFAAQVWHYVVGTTDATTLHLWVDGVLVATDLTPAVLTNTLPVSFGQASGGGNQAQAAFAEAAYYSHVLSNARIAAHFAAADQTTQAPVSTANGSLSGTSTNPAYTGLLQEILQSVRRVY